MSHPVILAVPCYNEARRLPTEAWLAYAEAQPEVGFVLVDDGSADSTWAVLQGLVQARPRSFAALRLPRNQGKAEAVRQGVRAALARGPDQVGYWDADLATPLEALAEFRAVLAERPGVELVAGSRVALLGRQVKRRPLRHYPGRVVATAVSLTLGLAVYDSQCGAKLFRANAATAGYFARPFLSRWLFDVEILARMKNFRRDRRLPGLEEAVYEVPLQAWRDVGASKVKAGDFLRAFVDLWRIRRAYGLG